MIIKIEPDLFGLATEAEVILGTESHVPLRLKITASHKCDAGDLFTLAKAFGEMIDDRPMPSGWRPR